MLANLVLPFELRPVDYDGKKAILLVHGLFESPFSMRDLGNFFYQQGFLVRAILLPGHGAVMEDLFHTDFQDWIRATQLAIDSLKKQAQQLYYGGFSTGASLGIYHSLAGAPLAGLILLAPACQLNYKVILANYLYHYFYWFTKNKCFDDSAAIDDPARYQRYPIKSAADVFGLIKKIDVLARYCKINVPLFMVLTHDDETINPQAAQRFFSLQAHPYSQLLYYSNSIDRFNDKRITIVSSRHCAEGIVNFSHICLAIAPDNLYYGKNSNYHKATKKSPANKRVEGAVTLKNIVKQGFRRLSYNPDFENMIKKIATFLSQGNH